MMLTMGYVRAMASTVYSSTCFVAFYIHKENHTHQSKLILLWFTLDQQFPHQTNCSNWGRPRSIKAIMVKAASQESGFVRQSDLTVYSGSN